MSKSSIQISKTDTGHQIQVRNLGVALKRENGSFTLFCPGLKVLGFSSKNEREAWIDFSENLEIFFKGHLLDKSLHDTLTSFDWKSRHLKKPDFNLDNSPSLTPKDFDLAIAA